MKLEIELDLNKIDYDAINKQIQEKIEALDIATTYNIDSKVNSMVKDQVSTKVNGYLCSSSYWSGLNTNSQREINDEIRKNIQELIAPHVKNIFDQIPQEELDKLISDLLPKVLMDMLSKGMRDMMTNYYAVAESNVYNFCDNRIREILGRPY